MKRAAFLLVLVALLTQASRVALGDGSVVKYSANGHYYQLITTTCSWSTARDNAKNKTYNGMAGHLVTITSSGENDFIQKSVLSGQNCWIGASQPSGSSEPSGGWQWVTGETWSYTNWNSGEPNNSGGAEHVAELYGNSGKWNDLRSSNSLVYVVEYEHVVFLSINSGVNGTRSTSVTLTLTWNSYLSLKEMRIRNSGEEWGDWTDLASTKPWTLTSGEGLKTVEAEFRNTDGTVFSAKDSIWLDLTAPTGSLLIQDGVDWTADPLVGLRHTFTDLQSGVTHMRLRNAGDDWNDWIAAAATSSWTLVKGEGLKTVEAQYRDAAGNVSETAADSIGVDQTPPKVSLLIEDGEDYTGSKLVTLTVDASDALSGVYDMRFRRVGIPNWEDWIPYERTHTFTMLSGDGTKMLEAQVRDRAGNVSPAARDSIVLDETPPACMSFRINAGRPYVLPGEDLVFEVYGFEAPGGSGVEGFKASFDGGKTWSGWYSLVGGYLTAVDRPEMEGLLTATIVLRDRVGNESATAEASCYLVESDLPEVGGGGKLSGTLAPAADVDAFAVGLVKGDMLTVKPKAKASEKGKVLLLALDLVGPGGDVLHTGRYPADAKKPMISRFTAPETGRYLVIVRRHRDSEADEGAVSVSIKVKQARTSKKGKGTSTRDIPINAAEGSTLKASLKGDGLLAEHVTLSGPGGPVPLKTKAKNGKVTILPTVLHAGTGVYVLHVSTPVQIAWKWSLKLPRKVKGVLGD